MNNNKVVACGNSGPGVRSDCEVKFHLKDDGGVIINLKSKVQTMYGKSIIELAKQVIDFFEIKNVVADIIDSGALPFVIMARLEAAIKLLIDSDKEFLPEMLAENTTASSADRFRFSRLYLPGNSPSMMLNAGLHSPDGLILDLEDSVAVQKKHEARFLVRNALRQINFYGAERMVRINQGNRGIEDLKYIIPQNVNLILVPKCEDPEYLKDLDREIKKLAEENNNSPVFIMPIIESALGVEMAYEIAKSVDSIVAMAIGLEDYTADIGVQRTNEGKESLYARTRIVNASKAAGIQAIDSVFSDVSDMKALALNVKESKAYGFEGMGCIHPRQIAVIKKAFAPDKQEIQKAARIVLAFREAEKKGLAVVSLGSKMIDPPVVIRAQKVIMLAERLKLLPEDWDKNVS